MKPQRMIYADALKELFPDNGEGSWTYNVTVKACIDAQPTIDAVPVVMIEGRINDLKKTLIDIDSDEVDNIWHLRIEIDALTKLLEMWAERKEK